MTDPKNIENDDTIRDGSERTGGIPKRIGRYAVKREIARGGMGVVFEALQDEPRRTVAVKVMKESIADDEALRRFRYESQLLARLRHPGIAQVYEAGMHETVAGVVPFFAMEYIPNAKPITEYARSKRLGTRERLELFSRVCDAVHHGHQRGIIHRDLKPGNILVDSHGQPRIIDFGVARATDSDMATVQTEVGQIIGSLQYMSPEQFEADPNDIDTRSDVYALGVVLYELMRGELPYDVRNTTIIEASRIVRDETPARLGEIDASLRGDIETIAVKAMEKDRDRRYQSAYGLAADIRRYLNGEPIAARPPSLGYQMRVFARRHRMFIVSAAIVFFALTAAAAVSTSAWIKAERERARAEAETEKTLAAVEFLKGMVSSAVPRSYGVDATLRDVLDVAAEGCATAFPDDPLTEAEVRTTIAWGYIHSHAWSEMGRHFAAALDIRRRILGPNDEQTIASLEDLSFLYGILGRTDDLEHVLTEKIKAETVLYGAEDKRTLESRSILSLTLAENEQFEEARAMASDVLEIIRRELGDEHMATANAMIGVALIALWQGRYDDAERLSREVLETCTRVFGEADETTRAARSQLGAVLVARGRLDEAEALYGSTPVPEGLGVIRTFQGDAGSPAEGTHLYVFWEAWCPYSQRAVPWLEDIHQRYKSEDLNIVGLTMVNRSSTDDKVREFIRANNITYPVLKENGSARRHFNMVGTPFITFVRDGKLVWEHCLPTEQFPEQLVAELIKAGQ